MNYFKMLMIVLMLVLVGCSKKSEAEDIPDNQQAFNECRKSITTQFNHGKDPTQQHKFVPSDLAGEADIYYLRGNTRAEFTVSGKKFAGSFELICAARKTATGKWSAEQYKYHSPKFD
jgi:hypothetical protein